MRAGGRIAETELADGLVGEFSLVEIRKSDCPPLFVVPQHILEILLGKLGHHQQALMFETAGNLFRCLLLLYDFDMILLGQILERLGIGQVLVLHHERDGIAGLAACETLEDTFARGDCQRRALVLMEGTDTPPVSATALEGDKIADDLFNPGGSEDFVFGSAVNHGATSQAVEVPPWCRGYGPSLR